MEVVKKKYKRLTKSAIGGYSCIAKFCNTKYYTNEKKASFFRLPSEPKRFKKWMINCRRYDLLDILKKPNAVFKPKNHRLCSLHFEPSEFFTIKNGVRLIKSAIPTLFSFNKPLSIGEHGFNLKEDFVVDPNIASVKQNVNTLPGNKMEGYDCEEDELGINVKKDYVGGHFTIKEEPCEEYLPPPAQQVDLSLVKTEESIEMKKDPFEDYLPSAQQVDLSLVKTEEYIHVFDGLQPIEEPLVKKISSSADKEINTNAAKKDLKCKECNKCFKSKSNLIVHLRNHTGEKPYNCFQCDKSFGSKAVLIQHFKIHTGEKPFMCSECDKSFSVKSNLTLHFRTHTGERPYKCSECNKDYVSSSDLTKHFRSHTGEKPYKCSECKKGFVSRSYLTMHLRIHKGEKPFKCSECDKSFATKIQQTNHNMAHTGEKPFKCSECDKRFATKIHLTHHNRKHTGEKPYKCSECDKSFLTKCQLTNHTLAHTGEKTFKCSQCDFRFACKRNLISHIRIMHKL